MTRNVPELRIQYIERGFPCKLCELEGIDIALPSHLVVHMTEHESLGFWARRKRVREHHKLVEANQ